MKFEDENIEKMLDDEVFEEVYKRINKPATLSLTDVFEDDDIDVDELIWILQNEEKKRRNKHG